MPDAARLFLTATLRRFAARHGGLRMGFWNVSCFRSGVNAGVPAHRSSLYVTPFVVNGVRENVTTYPTQVRVKKPSHDGVGFPRFRQIGGCTVKAVIEPLEDD